MLALVRERLGKHWVIGAPLGLGKPNHLINALYRAAKADPSIQLELFTALSLDPPRPGSGLRRRFLEPFLQRHFGDYPRLDYMIDLEQGQVPANIQISEFYFQSGSRLGNRHAQQHYLSSNYTHVARDMANRGVNLVVQMVARDPARPGYYSLSCNPDVTLDLLALVPREQLLVLLQVNDELPYMGGAAEIPASLADFVTDQAQPLFAVPLAPVSDQDLLIGLHCSQLIRDGGTLQLGIGSLGDAVTCCSLLRHEDNSRYLELLQATGSDWRVPQQLSRDWGGNDPFAQGLYAASEMLTEGFLHLYRGGVLKRRVYDHAGLQTLLNQGLLREELRVDCLEILWQHQLLPRHLEPDSLRWLQHFGILDQALELQEGGLRLPDGATLANDFLDISQREALAGSALGKNLKNGALSHAAFFLGSKWMYRQLREMPDAERELFQMTTVSRINQLYGGQLYGGEQLDRAQRLEARFINTTMKMSLLGAAVSDQLEHGQVVSGVGGQYNFVAMAQALDRARSILMLRSFRGSGKDAVSNIVWEFPHTTIPRHLRDIVVTEYGVADLRSLQDHEVIQALLCIADSRWQEELRREAVRAGKLDAGWSVPSQYHNNSPQTVAHSLRGYRHFASLKPFPFGSDFTPEEEQLAAALSYLQEHSQRRWNRLKLALRSLGAAGKPAASQQAALARMGLESVTSQGKFWRVWLQKRLLCLALNSTGQGKT
jgi:acyl-CoA hydrolase